MSTLARNYGTSLIPLPFTRLGGRPMDSFTSRTPRTSGTSGALPVQNTRAASATRPISNLALVPLSLLPYKERWQALANALPAGSILFCPPTSSSSEAAHVAQPRTWCAVIDRLRSTGRFVLVVSPETVLARH